MSKLLHGSVRTIVLELTRGLGSLYGERLRGVFVFGSYARDEAVEGSDLDVAVILDDFEDQWEEIQRTSHLSSELSLKHGVTISIVQVREREWLGGENPFLASVRSEAVPLSKSKLRNPLKRPGRTWRPPVAGRPRCPPRSVRDSSEVAEVHERERGEKICFQGTP